MILADMIEIGDEVVNSIDKNRMDNDQVLRKKIEVFNNLKNLAQSVSKTSLDKDIEEELLRQLAHSIREIETQLDIVAPN